MNKKLRELLAQKQAATAAARAITDKADKEGRDLTVDEDAEFQRHAADIRALNGKIEREQLLADEEASATPVATQSGSGANVTVTDNREQDPTRGFASVGQFFQAVAGAGQSRNRVLDDRLMIGAAAPGTFGNESSGADGGFLIPPAYSEDIYRLSLGEDALLPMTDDVEITGNSMSFPKDETTPWGTNGIRAFWQGEASTAQPTKPVVGLDTLRLKKLMALVPVTDELLGDAAALQSYLPGKVADSIRWKTNEAILFGAGGNGIPAGALASNAAVVVPKDSGQATNTLSPTNLANMIARLPPGSFGRAVWLINNDALPALFTLTLGNYPIYMPSSEGIKGSPYGMLLGRPVMVSQHAKSFSSQGDINLVDLSFYQTITKAEGIQTATSMHLYFDADLTAFRTIFRLDGQSKIANPIQPANGSKVLSPFVQLGAR
ncbi:phage major capsid protein [Chitinimonas sp.]|uniref:phage major capsid protein n=1 Tax=Chitinimonas sp. TaxID=1934313 RepID=UPI0035B4ECAC